MGWGWMGEDGIQVIQKAWGRGAAGAQERAVGEENQQQKMKTIKKPIAGYPNFKNLLTLARNPNKILI